MFPVSFFACTRNRADSWKHPPRPLDGAALLVGAIWLVIGVGVLARITRGFKVDPPEMEA